MPRYHAKLGAPLSFTELCVLRMIAEGNTDAQTATLLDVKTSTITTHIEHIFSKLGARNRAHAMVLAFREGLIQ